MKPKVMFNAVAICLAASSAVAVAASGSPGNVRGSSEIVDIKEGWAKTLPVKGWPVDAEAFIAQRKQAMGKAGTDLATVFRPVTPCRMVDTRGFGAPIQGGPIAGTASGTRRFIDISGTDVCGITDEAVAISISFAVRNNTPNSGGTLSFVYPTAPVDTVASVFNFGDSWTSSNVIVPTDEGSFEIVVASADVDIAIDVNGYFDELGELAVADQNLDITGNALSGGGNVLEVTQLGLGDAIRANSGSSGAAMRIGEGRIAVSGAGVDSDTTAFIHRTDATGVFGSGGSGNLCSNTLNYISVIDHPMLNSNADALVFITPREDSLSSPNAGPIRARYFQFLGCASASTVGKWAIVDASNTAFQTGDLYNVLIIDN